MLVKLLKYDLKYMIKNMSVFYILALFFAIVTRVLYDLDQSVIINIIGQISFGCLCSMIFSILFNTMIRSWVRFKDSIYKDEAYLTHTLPVTKNEIYDSKFIQTLLFFIIGFVVIIISLFITYYSKENWEIITNYIRTITIGLNMSTAFFITIAFIVIFLEVFNAIQCGFFGIILGYKRSNYKVGYSILFGFIIYLIAQTLVLLLVFMYGLFDSSVMDLFKTSEISINVDAFKTLGITASVLYLVIIAGMNILCKKILNKGVNIE